MASSPESAPSTDSDSPPTPPTESSPPPSSSPSPPSPPAPTTSSPPPSSSPSLSPPTSSSPPPLKNTTSPPPPKSTPSPPSPDNNDQSPTSSSPPPPSSSDNDTPRPPSDSSSSSMVPPPPPHSRAKSPPSSSDALSPPSHSKNTSTHHSKTPPSSHDSSDLPVAAIVGITAAVLIVFIVFIAILGYCCMRKKKRRSHDHMQYYDPSHMHNGSGYYNSGPNWYNSPQKMDHVVKVPPPPGAMGPPGAMWASPPPPPMHSSDMSSNFSGPHGPPLPPPSPSIALGFNNKSTFSYDELAAATDGFSQANLLGQGGFGYVYKGKLPNGKEIAVKQLKSGSGQGEREFQAEVEIISRVHHRHLVSLVGYSIAGGQRILIYEFVPNNTLEYHLHGEERPTMDFPTRLKIALGSAKGLAYLHEDCHPKIIHRDIKTANILLDYNFEAMVADFGLAKLSSDTNTHVSTRVMGTFGYLAPEYASSGKLTEKSDVFSYGVMLLELITGRRPVDNNNAYMDDSLVEWARPILSQALEGGNYGELIDPRLQDNYDPNEMMRMMASAAACVRHSARRRPKMSQVVRLLEGDVSLQDLNEGVRPGHSTVFGSVGGSGSEYDSTQYNADMRQFRKMALATEGFSSEYSGHSSDYSRAPSVRSSEGSHSREVNQRRSP